MYERARYSCAAHGSFYCSEKLKKKTPIKISLLPSDFCSSIRSTSRHSERLVGADSTNMQAAISLNRFVVGDDKACFGSALVAPRSGRAFSGPRRKVTNLSISAASKNVAAHEIQDALKRALAKKAMDFVKSGMVVGLGTGSTASIAIEELGKLIKQRKLKDIVAVGANYQSRVLARQYGVATVDLNDVNKIDIAIDGVDEVDLNKNLLKGGGAAHTMQKIVDTAARECIILADQSKVVPRLGTAFPIPVEVLPPAVTPVLRKLLSLGGFPEIRSALRKDGPVISDLGNMIVDVSFPGGIQDPAELEKNIKLIPGVVENGIVTGIATTVLVGIQDGDDITVVDLADFGKIVSTADVSD